MFWWTFKALGGVLTLQVNDFWSTKTILCSWSMHGCLQTASACWIWAVFACSVACKSLFHAFCMRKSLLWQDQLHHYSLNIIALCALQWVGSISWKKEAYWKWWVFGNCPFLHVRIMMDFAGSTGPFSTGLSLPAFNDLIEANGLCPVWFRLKLMKLEAFSVSMDIVAQWHGSFFSGPAHGSNACTSLLFSLAYIK